MQFQTIALKNVRSFTEVDLVAQPGLNLVFGDNGSGKTSLLEAVNLLSRARSFRTHRLNDIIRRGQQSMQVTANLLNDSAEPLSSGIEREARQTRIKFAGEEIKKVSDQARNLPILVLTPESQGLLGECPREKRRWLDWTLFHVEPDYLRVLAQYQKALRQRNQLLRTTASPAEFQPWEQAMSEAAEKIEAYCTSIVSRLQQIFDEQLSKLIEGSCDIRYRAGWKTGQPLQQILVNERDTDRQFGYTRAGPHRADVNYYFQQDYAVKTLSRGQAKLYMVALLLAQAALIKEITHKRPVILIDDVFAELDQTARTTVSKRLAELEAQSFITSTDKQMQDYCAALFHVKQGAVEHYH